MAYSYITRKISGGSGGVTYVEDPTFGITQANIGFSENFGTIVFDNDFFYVGDEYRVRKFNKTTRTQVAQRILPLRITNGAQVALDNGILYAWGNATNVMISYADNMAGIGNLPNIGTVNQIAIINNNIIKTYTFGNNLGVFNKITNAFITNITVPLAGALGHIQKLSSVFYVSKTSANNAYVYDLNNLTYLGALNHNVINARVAEDNDYYYVHSDFNVNYKKFYKSNLAFVPNSLLAYPLNNILNGYGTSKFIIKGDYVYASRYYTTSSQLGYLYVFNKVDNQLIGNFNVSSVFPVNQVINSNFYINNNVLYALQNRRMFIVELNQQQISFNGNNWGRAI
jgi:hypothetical protein